MILETKEKKDLLTLKNVHVHQYKNSRNTFLKSAKTNYRASNNNGNIRTNRKQQKQKWEDKQLNRYNKQQIEDITPAKAWIWLSGENRKKR